jgi:hypothetical protein
MAESSMLRPVTSTRAFCSPFRGPTKSWRTKSSGRFCRSLPIPTSASFSQRSSRCPNHSPVTCSAENQQAIDRVLQSLSFGGGAVNQTNIFLFIESMPYRGVGTSGIGNYDWKYGYGSLTARQVGPDISSGRGDRSLISTIYPGKGSSTQSVVRLLVVQKELPSCRRSVAKNHAGGTRFRDQSVLLVGYGALHIADRLAPPHDRPFRFELCLPDWAKEVDFQFDRSERLFRRESARKRNAHRGVSNIAKNPSVQRSHGICMLWSGCQDDCSPSVCNVFRLKSNQASDCNVVRFGSFPKVRLWSSFLCTHDLWAPVFAFRARTLVSRYSSR